jgi:hypothetical protein
MLFGEFCGQLLCHLVNDVVTKGFCADSFQSDILVNVNAI